MVTFRGAHQEILVVVLVVMKVVLFVAGEGDRGGYILMRIVVAGGELISWQVFVNHTQDSLPGIRG